MKKNEKRVPLKGGGTAIVDKDCNQKTLDSLSVFVKAVKKHLMSDNTDHESTEGGGKD